MAEPKIPTGLYLVQVVLDRLGEHSYDGGVNGTCYGCPFASEPLERDGRTAHWPDISNDPTEAYFRCFLPGRDSSEVAWGEYAPCNEKEWAAAALTAFQEAVRGLLRIYGCVEGFSVLGMMGTREIRKILERILTKEGAPQ